MVDVPIRVAVISRNHIVRHGLVSLVAQLKARAVVTEATSIDEALLAHDVAIYDLGGNRGRDDYHDLARLLDEGVQVICLVYDPQRDTVPASVGPALHVITLSTTPGELMQVLSRTTGPREQHRNDPVSLDLPGGLTIQQFRTLELIGAGLANDEIAKEMFVSINTIKTYVRTAYRKIGVSDRQGAMLWALEHGISGGPDRR